MTVYFVIGNYGTATETSNREGTHYIRVPNKSSGKSARTHYRHHTNLQLSTETERGNKSYLTKYRRDSWEQERSSQYLVSNQSSHSFQLSIQKKKHAIDDDRIRFLGFTSEKTHYPTKFQYERRYTLLFNHNPLMKKNVLLTNHGHDFRTFIWEDLNVFAFKYKNDKVQMKKLYSVKNWCL